MISTAPRRRLARSVGSLAILTFLASACSSSETQQSSDDTIVVTTALWADVVNHVACDGNVAIETLIPEDADPHAYEPTFQDQDRLASATLLVQNGRGLEGAWVKAIDDAAENGTPIFTMADHVESTPGLSDDDPHIWFDPIQVAGIVPELAAAIVASTSADETTTLACAADYVTELEALDARVTTLAESVPAEKRLLITNHDAFEFFANRYGFEVVDTILPTSTLAEVSPAELEALEATILERGITTVFAEHQHSGAEAEAIADRLGATVSVVYLYTEALGEAGSGADSYIGLVETDANLITEALNR